MPYLTTPRGLKWHYQSEGEGDNLVFLHGWGVNSRIWRQQAKYFSERYRVTAIDLPGHGQSGWQPVDLDGIAGEMLVLFDEIGVSRMYAVGSSFGGIVALKLIERDPQRITKLTLAGSQPRFCAAEDYPFGLEEGRIHKLAGQLEAEYPAMVHIFFRSLFTKHERGTRRYRWIQTFRKADSVPQKNALLHTLDILRRADVRPVLEGLKIPVQFINGTEDYICRREIYEYYRRVLPQARFDWFEKCGHFPFLIYPHDFNRMLSAFLKEKR